MTLVGKPQDEPEGRTFCYQCSANMGTLVNHTQPEAHINAHNPIDNPIDLSVVSYLPLTLNGPNQNRGIPC